jgi:nitrite reductase/ring-hydroxylating ferredoxin subunit
MTPETMPTPEAVPTPEAMPVPDPSAAQQPASHARRTVLRGAAVVGALGLAGGLAACGGGDEETVDQGSTGGDTGGSGGTDTGDTGGTGGGKVLAKTADIPSGGGKIFSSEKVVVTQPSMGEYKAFTAVCTHEKCIVADVTDTINCACHGSKFSITDGSVKAPPAKAPLAAVKITVTADSILLA